MCFCQDIFKKILTQCNMFFFQFSPLAAQTEKQARTADRIGCVERNQTKIL